MTLTNYKHKLFLVSRRILKAGYRRNRIRVSSWVLSEKALTLSAEMYEELVEKYGDVKVVEEAILEIYNAQ